MAALIPTLDMPCLNGGIAAHSNSPGPRLALYVPELLAIEQAAMQASTSYGYSEASQALLAKLASSLGVSTDSVWLAGSALGEIQSAAVVHDTRFVLALEGDFTGHNRPELFGAAVLRIEARHGHEADALHRLCKAAGATSRPLIFLPAGPTNPLGVSVDPRIWVPLIQKANPDARILIDTAYAHSDGLSQSELAKWVVESELPNVAIIAPAAKVFLCPGPRISWYVSGDPAMLARIRRFAMPYPAAGSGHAHLEGMLDAPEVVAKAQAVVNEAALCLRSGLPLVLRSAALQPGLGPWALLRFADAEQATSFVRHMAAGSIRVQQQAGGPAGLGADYVRISATVPCEAEAILSVASRFAN